MTSGAVFELIDCGLLNTVQDLGRAGYRDIGVSVAGAMDPLALRAGNLLLGNPEDGAAIEVQTFPFRVRVLRDTVLAVTGALCDLRLNDRALPPWWAIAARAGDVLALGAPRHGARAYLCVAGGIDVPMVMGSRATALRGGFGGLDGRSLRAGDRLAAHDIPTLPVLPAAGYGVTPPEQALAAQFPQDPPGRLTLRALPAGEHDLFAQDAIRFWEQDWTISARSDRTGFRLSGTPIQMAAPLEMRSHGLMPGVVQVPPAGEPIVQMVDANTAGGYPKIAGIIEADLWRLGQARPGTRLRFRRTDTPEILAAEAAIDAWLADVAHSAPLLRRALAALGRT